MKTLNTLLVDDELSALEGLKLRLDRMDGIHIIDMVTSIDEAIECVKRDVPDLIFLDIQMPGKGGFDLLKQFQPEQHPAIVFVTAFHQYAVRAFEVEAVDYLLKPVRQSRLIEAVERVRARRPDPLYKQQLLTASAALESKDQAGATPSSSYRVEREKLIITDGRNSGQLVPFSEIVWIDAAGDYMCIHTHNETYVMRARLKHLVDTILPPEFVRIHKSTAVNIRYIQHIEALRNSEYRIELTNEKALKVSRTYSAALKTRLFSAQKK
ncbi:LytTR family DNA-binding domain-containing protein [Idiomarina sp.]|uniref:LytR/AlgR family response regulator transcription factor n=1 Tax=Idiomarina sp. TaxID=1874361 RepID=UPI0025BD1EAD|nr:LytTR family DNA-binding domain-containing protein [Idiomarina sp.]